MLSFYCIGEFTDRQPESFQRMCGDFLDRVNCKCRPTDLQPAPFDRILYGLMTLGSALSIPGKRKLHRLFGSALHAHPHVGTYVALGRAVKPCRVNTTWKQTAAGRHLKGNSVLCQPRRLVFGVEKFRWPLKSYSRFVLTSCPTSAQPKNAHQRGPFQ